MRPERLAWPTLMRLGLGGLRLSPDVFWAMTPVELLAALEGAGLIGAPGEAGIDRGTLDALMGRFPDRIEEGEA